MGAAHRYHVRVWCGSARVHRKHRYGSHVAYESETRRSVTHARECRTAETTGPGSLRSLRHFSIAAWQPMPPHCRANTATRDLVVGDTFQDRRQPGHQDAPRTSTPAAVSPQQTSQSRKENPSTTAHSQITHSGTLHSPSMMFICSVTYAEPQQWPPREALGLVTQ